MITNREIVSRATNRLKFLNKDDRVSKRYILNIAEKHAENLISQKLLDKTLFRESDIYSFISCLDLESKDTYSCGIVEFQSCHKLMRSKKKLDGIVFSRYGGAVRNISPIDFMSQHGFKLSTLSEFKRDKRRHNEYDKAEYAFLKDGYIYLPDVDVRKIALEVLVVNTFKLAELDSDFQKSCKSAWDYEFKCPQKLLSTVIELTRNELLDNKQVVEDENPNMDNNIKSRA